MRLDLAVLSRIANKNRSAAQRLIKSGAVAVNGRILRLPGKRITESDKIKIFKKNYNKDTRKFKPTVLYEDRDCIVLDKPAGMLTHSKGAELLEMTVDSWLAGYLRTKTKSNRNFIVHRLDRGTSGVIICAKDEQARKKLQKQFSDRKAEKSYYAIVSGKPSPDEAIIEAPIERNPKKPSKFRASENGKPATTHYKLEKTTARKKPISKLLLRPKTGRTHQIRVHMAYIGHPVVGDKLYGGQPADRLYLHAARLKLKLPSGETREFNSKLPAEFDNLLARR